MERPRNQITLKKAPALYSAMFPEVAFTLCESSDIMQKLAVREKSGKRNELPHEWSLCLQPLCRFCPFYRFLNNIAEGLMMNCTLMSHLLFSLCGRASSITGLHYFSFFYCEKLLFCYRISKRAGKGKETSV